jgi:hypothetical protein
MGMLTISFGNVLFIDRLNDLGVGGFASCTVAHNYWIVDKEFRN